MVNGIWNIQLSGTGKIYPADANEIQELLVSFIQTLTAAGHDNVKGHVRKDME
jgi:hypothetical protein